MSPTLEQAEVLVQQGKLAEASQLVDEELQLNPASVEAYNIRGFIRLDQKDMAGAVEAFQQALKISPGSAKTLTNLGNAYVAEKKFDLAEKEFRTVLRLNPDNRDANYNLGLVLIAKSSAAAAIPYLERVRPPTVETRLNLIRAYLESNKAAEGIRLADHLSAQNPDNVQLHFSLGLLLASEGQYKGAELELERADVLRPDTFEILYNLGQTYLRSGDNSKAELVSTRALKQQPGSAEALYLLAQVYTAESRPLDALDLLVKAHKIAPENVNVTLLMAKISMTENYYEDAIPLLESAVQIAPQRSDVLAALGKSYFMAGKVDKAVETFRRLIAVDPSAPSYAYMGICYRHLGRFEEAKQYFEDGLKLDPHDSSCLFNLGYIAERQGDYKSAEAFLQQTIHYHPDYPDALLEMANLRIIQKNYAEAASLLRRYVQVGRDPSTGYYKLAMVERNLHDTQAADRDLKVFQTLSKDSSTGPYPYEHLFDYLDNRAKLDTQDRNQQDISQLTDEIKKHPDQPQDLYLLAQAYLKAGKTTEAQDAIAQLDQLSTGDYKTQTGTGVLLARYHYYDEAIHHFQNALTANPESDEVKFDLADAYFREGKYREALATIQQISEAGRKDDASLALQADIYSHLNDPLRAEELYREAITRNPDNDQDYLSLALLELRQDDLPGAKATLQKGEARVPGSGKILWGLGLVSVLEGKTTQAAEQFEHAVDLLPEWPGSYSTLGVFYFQTGQVTKAKEVLDRFKGSDVNAALDVGRIEQVLAQASDRPAAAAQPMTAASRQQLLQFALSLADKTL